MAFLVLHFGGIMRLRYNAPKSFTVDFLGFLDSFALLAINLISNALFLSIQCVHGSIEKSGKCLFYVVLDSRACSFQCYESTRGSCDRHSGAGGCCG
jgi:hypothetical protein